MRGVSPLSPWLGGNETAELNLFVCLSVHRRDRGCPLPQYHVPICRGPDLADTDAPLHACVVGSSAAHTDLCPQGPDQGQAVRATDAHPAAGTYSKVGDKREQTATAV